MCNIYICVGTYNIVRLALAGRRSTYGQCNTLLNDSPIISFDRIIFIYEQLKSREDTQIQTCSFFCHDSYVDSLLTSLETSILGEDKDMACPHVRDDRINGGMDKESGKKDRRILLVIGVVSLTLIMAVGVTMLFHFNDHHQLRKLGALLVVLFLFILCSSTYDIDCLIFLLLLQTQLNPHLRLHHQEVHLRQAVQYLHLLKLRVASVDVS